MYAAIDYVRSVSVRRLAYLLLCGEKNEFVAVLPGIQEKLVDIFRNVSAPPVLAEAFLCVRVLLVRLSARSLASFWPVIMSESWICDRGGTKQNITFVLDAG